MKFYKIIVAVLAAVFLFGCGAKQEEASGTAAPPEGETVQADSQEYVEDPNAPKIFIDGEQLKTMSPPEIRGDIMVPFRDIFNALGVTDIEWSAEEQKIVARKDSNTVVLFIDREDAVSNGTISTLKSPPYVNSKNYTMVPVKFVVEAMGASYQWDGENKIVTITTKQ